MGLPGVYNQGSLGSCTANAVSFAYHCTELKQNNLKRISPSRLFLYYNTRALMGKTAVDSGAGIRTTMQAAAANGMCAESMWPYLTSRFADKPSAECYVEGVKCVVNEYISVPQTLENLKSVLVDGYPIAYGFNVYASFDRVGLDGKMPIPNKATEKINGGHAVCIVGYDDTIRFDDATQLGGFIVRNSWGVLWGAAGYFYVPYSVMLDTGVCSSFWFIRQVSNPGDVVVPPFTCCDGCACIVC